MPKAQVIIKNECGLNIVSLVVNHKYSDVHKDKLEYSNIAPGGSEQGPTGPHDRQVEYNTGFLTTGRDWWQVTWGFDGDTRILATTPNNFRSFIDGLESLVQVVLPAGAAAAGTGGAAGAAVGAAVAAVGTQLFNREGTAGYKQHILRKEDSTSNTSRGVVIIIRADFTVQFQSPSGSSHTVWSEIGRVN